MLLADLLEPGLTGWRDIHAALKPYNEPGDSTAGHLFEEFAKYYFQTAPECKEFAKVWGEKEVPRKVRQQLTLADRDHGVDLVLQTKDGRYYCVQVKFKTDQSKTLGWTADRLSSWLAESDEAQGLIIFTNASGIDDHSARKAKKKDFRLWTVGDLLGMAPDRVQAVLALAEGNKPKPAPKFKPERHQNDAIREVLEGFKAHDRGQLILPCGAGKTLTALWIKERMKVKKTLVLVPSLALLRQIYGDWTEQQKTYLPYLCVCSEKDIDKGKDAIRTHTFEVGGRVTTDAKEIRKFVRENDEFVIYCTYQSLDVIEEAKTKFDLAICDEAHKTAGSRDKAFALIHDGKRIKAQKRLYMTATPRITGYKAKKNIEELEEIESAYELVADMNDAKIFGPEFHRMSFAKAIKLGVLSDYQIILLGVSDKDLNKYVNKRAYTEKATLDQEACIFALQKVMRKYKAKHAITFHNTIDRAEVFQSLHRENYKRTWVEHVNGTMSTNDRAVLMDGFKNEKKAILTNAKCLTEGVDVPAIDCVVFVDPKKSTVDIVQAAGRALRVLKEDRGKPVEQRTKQKGYIVVPIFHENPEEVDEKLKTSAFKPILDVIHALSAHDERVAEEMNRFRFGEGARKPSKGLIEVTKVERFVLEGFETNLKKSLFTQIVKRVPTLRSTEGLLTEMEFAERMGVVSSSVYKWRVAKRITPHGYGFTINGIGAYYHPDQVEETKKNFGITLTSTEGLLNEVELSKRLGVTISSILNWRKENRITPHGFGFHDKGSGAFYRPEQIKEIRRELGITLDCTEGLLNESEFARAVGCGSASMRRWRDKDKITPYGYGFHQKGSGWFYHPDQVEEVRKRLGATIVSTEGLLTEKELADALGVSNATVLKWKTSGKISPYGSTFDRSYYHPKQLEELRRKFGVTLTSTEGLLSETAFASALGTSRTVVAKLRKAKKIAPRGFGFNRSKVGALYHPDQIEEVMQQFGITLTATDGLLSEKEFASKLGKTAPALWHWRKSGKITPYGTTFNGAFYHPDQLEEVQGLMGPVVPEELLGEKELAQELGVSVGTVRNWRTKNKIEPAKQVSERNRVRAYYHPDQVEEIRKQFGVTLDSTDGLLSEKEFAKEVGVPTVSVAKSRLNGRIKPTGYGFRPAGVGAYYHPDQVKEHR